MNLPSPSKLFIRRTTVVVCAAVGLVACDPPQTPPKAPPAAPKQAGTNSNQSATPMPDASQRGSLADARPEPPSPPEEPAPDPVALAAKFRAEQDEEVRAEIVADLWEIGSPAAVEMLRGLFIGERNEDVKADILSGVADVEGKETHESCYGLLVSALAPGQPAEIRLLATHLLLDFEDARIPGLLQQFTQDADAEVREAAKDAIESLKEN